MRGAALQQSLKSAKDIIPSSSGFQEIIPTHLWICIKVREFDGHLLRTAQLIGERRNQYILDRLIGRTGLGAGPLIKRRWVADLLSPEQPSLRNTTFQEISNAQLRRSSPFPTSPPDPVQRHRRLDIALTVRLKASRSMSMYS
jgi:hypothetical protein